MAEGPVSGTSKGGMELKIAAAKIATAAGVAVIIANGHRLHPLKAAERRAQNAVCPATQSGAGEKALDRGRPFGMRHAGH